MPLILTLTIPAGLLAAVMIVFGRMSSDRELVALKAAGIGLAPVVAPVIVLAMALSLVDYWLVAYVVPQCQKELNSMKHEIVTSNPMALLNPQEIVDKIPGSKILFERKHDNSSTISRSGAWTRWAGYPRCSAPSTRASRSTSTTSSWSSPCSTVTRRISPVTAT